MANFIPYLQHMMARSFGQLWLRFGTDKSSLEAWHQHARELLHFINDAEAPCGAVLDIPDVGRVTCDISVSNHRKEHACYSKTVRGETGWLFGSSSPPTFPSWPGKYLAPSVALPKLASVEIAADHPELRVPA